MLGLAVLVFFQADGNSDPHYYHFASSKQKSLILGTSKAAQGLQPDMFDSILNRKDIYNYAFTVAHSPYGPAYLRSIKSKLTENTKDGIFIITIDPYAVSSRLKNPNDTTHFRENSLAVANIENVSSKPNFQYLLKYYGYQYIYILTKKINYVNDDFVHENGWEEVNISMRENALNERIESKLEDYKNKLPEYHFSEVRYSYFERTIEFLKKHGKVFIVRLPVSEPFLIMENSINEDFDNLISKSCEKFNVPYLDFTKIKNDYRYTDGNHLYKTTGAEVSKKIAIWIKGT